MDEVSIANLTKAMASVPIGADAGGAVWPVNVAIVQAFLAVSTQWRTSSRGGGGFASMMGGAVAPVRPLWIGLDYAAVRAGLDALQIAVTPALWHGVRVMEIAACEELNKDN